MPSEAYIDKVPEVPFYVVFCGVNWHPPSDGTNQPKSLHRSFPNRIGLLDHQTQPRNDTCQGGGVTRLCKVLGTWLGLGVAWLTCCFIPFHGEERRVITRNVASRCPRPVPDEIPTRVLSHAPQNKRQRGTAQVNVNAPPPCALNNKEAFVVWALNLCKPEPLVFVAPLVSHPPSLPTVPFPRVALGIITLALIHVHHLVTLGRFPIIHGSRIWRSKARVVTALIAGVTSLKRSLAA